MTTTTLATQEQLDAVRQTANAMAASAGPAVSPNTFIYYVGFDGTNNIAGDPRVAGDTQNTAVAQLLFEANAASSGNSKAAYFPGVGTPGTLVASSLWPTEQSVRSAREAYEDYAASAAQWLDEPGHEGGTLTAMMVSFSRGSIAGLIFSQMLLEEGLVYHGDDGTTRVLLPPGDASISANLMLSPVATGGPNPLVLPSNVQNTVVVNGQDEDRTLFHQLVYTQPTVNNLQTPANHGDVGDIYDRGIGAILLQGGNDYFANAGLPMSAIAPSRLFDPSSPVYIHTEVGSFLSPFAPWNYVKDGPSADGNSAQLVIRTSPDLGTCKSDGTDVNTFTDWKVDTVINTTFGGKTLSIETIPRGATAGTVYINPNPPNRLIAQNSDGSITVRAIDVQGNVLQSTTTSVNGDVTQAAYQDGVISGYLKTFAKGNDGSQSIISFEADGVTPISAVVSQANGDFTQTHFSAGVAVDVTRSSSRSDGSFTVDRYDGTGTQLLSSGHYSVDNSYVETEYYEGQITGRRISTTSGSATRTDLQDSAGNTLSTSIIQNNIDGTQQTSLFISNGPTTVTYYALNNSSRQIVYPDNSDRNIQTVTQTDSSGVPVSVQTVTPTTDANGSRVANSYSFVTRDASDNISETGAIEVNPVDGTKTVYTLLSSGATTTIAYDLQGNAMSSPDNGFPNLGTAVSSLYDAYNIVRAVQNHQDLSVIGGSLTLANDLTKGSVPQLGNAATAISGVSDLLGLGKSLQRGDAAGVIVNAAGLVNVGATLYANSLYTAAQTAAAGKTALQLATATTDAFGSATSTVSTISADVPYLAAFYELAQGNVGAAVADAVGAYITGEVLASASVAAAAGAEAGSIVPVVGTVIGAVFGYVIGSLLEGDPPVPWGSASFTWNGVSGAMTVSSTGDAGGDQVAAATLTELSTGLANVVNTFDITNPNTPVGLIANRLGSLSYGAIDSETPGFHVATVDLATGKDAYPNLRFSASAPYGTLNATPADSIYFQNLQDFYIQSALQREAIAPLWEVQTAQLQSQNRLTDAGLSEVERAADHGHLAAALPAGATTEAFNPIGLDFGGGLATSSLAQSTVQFDVDGTAHLDAAVIGQIVTHFEKNTAWLNKTDGFLVLDKNLNGQIDDGEEMFSNSAVAVNARGIASLATVDANGDGVIDASDPVFSKLQVWRDANGDGVAQASEEVGLQSLGITSLNYRLGTFAQGGQTRQMTTLDLLANTAGNAYAPTAGGIAITNTNGQTSIAVTQVQNLASIAPGEDGITTQENTPVTVLAHGSGAVPGLLDNDVVSNAPNALLSLTDVGNAQHGSVAFDMSTQSVTFTPDVGYSGSDAGFDYDVSAGPYGQAKGHVQVAVGRVDIAPKIASEQNSTSSIYGYTLDEGTPASGSGDSRSEGTPDVYTAFFAPGEGYANTSKGGFGYQASPQADPLSGIATATDADDPASSLVWSIASQGHDGVAHVDPHTGAWSFVPSSTVVDTDAFVLKVTDSSGLSDTLEISVPLFAPATGPRVIPGNGSGLGDGAGDGAGDPIILDLNGTGFDFQSLNGSNVFFQQAADGWRHQTAWFSGGNGVLAVDKFGDGIIHDSSQIDLTGFSTSALNDLQGLATFDSNGDGVVDKSDARWSDLGVWVDANQNGVSDSGEYSGMDALGITSLSLSSNNQFSVVNGTTINGVSSFTRADGTKGNAADVTFTQSGEVEFTNPDGTTTVKQVAQASTSGDFVTGDGNDLVLGAAGNNRIQVGNGNSVILSGAGDDMIAAGDGNNTIQTGDGKDVVTVGNGNNTIFLGNGPKLVVLNGSGNNLVVGGSGSNEILGGAANDVLYAGTGNSLLYGGKGDDLLVGGTGHSALVGGEGDDTMTDGGGQADMAGGLGNDTYVVTNGLDVVTENGNEGTDTVKANISYALGSDVENLTMIGTRSIVGTGNALANVLIGNGAADTLVGGAGNDTLADSGGAADLIGGFGDDTYIVANPGTRVNEETQEGDDTVNTRVSFILPVNVEHLVGIGNAALTLTGNGQDGGSLRANDADDTLVAGDGAVTLIGGKGNNTFVVNSARDVVLEKAGEGVDTILSSVDYSLGANIENLTLTGAAFRATGNELNNLIVANGFKDTLDGGVGADTMVGGAGSDTFIVDNIGDVVKAQSTGFNAIVTSVSFVAAQNIREIIATGSDDLTLTGNSLDDVIQANSGNDTLIAGSGNDAFIGGTGDDKFELFAGNYTVALGSGRSTVTGGNGNTQLTGGSSGSSDISLGSGNNVVGLSENNSDNNVSLGSGSDVVIYGYGNNHISKTDTSGVIGGVSVTNGNNTIQVGEGNNHISFGYGQNIT